jgi:hypothetical protein
MFITCFQGMVANTLSGCITQQLLHRKNSRSVQSLEFCLPIAAWMDYWNCVKACSACAGVAVKLAAKANFFEEFRLNALT